jgi:hypothetical protein
MSLLRWEKGFEMDGETLLLGIRENLNNSFEKTGKLEYLEVSSNNSNKCKFDLNQNATKFKTYKVK